MTCCDAARFERESFLLKEPILASQCRESLVRIEYDIARRLDVQGAIDKHLRVPTIDRGLLRGLSERRRRRLGELARRTSRGVRRTQR